MCPLNSEGYPDRWGVQAFPPAHCLVFAVYVMHTAPILLSRSKVCKVTFLVVVSCLKKKKILTK